MTAYTINSGADTFFDAQTGGSVNATLDSYQISNRSRLVVRTDSNACANHSVAFGSLDTVTFSGTGGTLHFDPTYVRVIAYTGGSGNSPAFGATISQGGVSGVFLGAWTTNWQTECIVPGAAIGAAGFIKVGGVTGGNFAAGALTGITATCSGPDVQGWIEVRGDTVATITVPRIGAVTSTEAWFELGTTSGTAGQILSCPTTATNASTFPGVWIETGVGTGVYERFASVGTVVALATHRTDASMKVITQTTGGIRIGNDGTNNVFFLPGAGRKVRIPATILTNSTRTVSGTGPRVLPNATIATRQEFVTTGAGYFDLRGIVSQWYMNFSQAFYVKYKSCAISDAMILSEIASPLDVDDCIVAPTAAQLNTALQITSCFAGGTVQNSDFVRFSLAASGAYITSLNYVTGVTFSGNKHISATLRANGTTGAITSTQPVNCTFTNETYIGGRGLFVGAQRCTFNNLAYYDHTITTTTSATNPMYALDFTTGCADNTVNGFSMPLPANGPYNGLVSVNACYNTLVRNIGTTYTAPLVMNASVTGLIVNGGGNNDGITMKRCYVSNTRSGPYAFVNSDTNIVVENCAGDAADTSVVAGLNAVIKNALLTGATTGQVSVYGSHWLTRFTSTTAGFAEITCNEPTSSSAAQCSATGGSPQFNSNGSVLLTKVGDQVTWEMPFFATGFTAFTNSAPTITGTNVTFSAGSTWGNHTLEFQVDTGSGYGGTWLALNAATLIGQTFNSTTGFRLKIRATCLTANAGNVLTNLRVALTTTQTDRDTKLYPLSIVTLTLTGLVAGSDVVVRSAGSSTVLASVDANAGTTWGYVYETPVAVDIDVIKPGYVPFPLVRNFTLSSTDSSLPVSQQVDRNYL
jgi:hypothetical protein